MAEARLERPRAGLVVLALAAVLATAAPWAVEGQTLRLAVEVFVMIAMAQAWNLLAGYTGFVSVGQQAFVGLGAYALFLAAIRGGIDAFTAVLIGGGVAAAVGALAAPALFRLRGPQFAIGTWVLAELLRIAFTNIEWFGGASGLTLARALRGVPLERRVHTTYWIALALAVGATLAVYLLLRSPFGLALRTVRDNEASAQSVGVAVGRVKFRVFVLASFLTGCAGAVSYLNTMFVTTSAAFALEWSALVIFVVIIGGLGTLEGPILGALVYFALREWLADHGTWYVITLGATAIAVMMLAPEGLWGRLSRRTGWVLFPARVRLVRPRRR
jgi:branched-chain amino acid transport system permease protein